MAETPHSPTPETPSDTTRSTSRAHPNATDQEQIALKKKALADELRDLGPRCGHSPKQVLKLIAAAGDDLVKLERTAIRWRRLLSDPPRLLHRNPVAARQDYTHDPAQGAAGEPEAVDATTLERFATGAYARDTIRHQRQADAQRGDLADRVSALLDAHAAGIDVSRQLAAIERATKRAERRLGEGLGEAA